MKYLEYREQKQQGTYEFPLAFYDITPGAYRYQMPYHWHPEYEIILIKEGEFRLTLDGQVYIAGKDSILFIHAGALHGGMPEQCIYQCIVFDMKLLISGNLICNKWIQQVIRNEIRLPVVLSGLDVRINNITKELFSLLEAQKKGYEFQVQSSLYQWMGILYETGHYESKAKEIGRTSIYIDRLKQVITYIEEHYTEAITLEDLARVAGLNARYFCRFFKKLTNQTPIEYLNYYRIDCACLALKERKASITEVAYSCGFNDSSYFIKVFHEAKKLTPRQYQEAEGIL